MTKLKKYTLALVVVALIASGALLGCTKEKWGTSVFAIDDPNFSNAGDLYMRASLIKDEITRMISEGSAPENITFTGVKSRNDVFGSGRVKIADVAPPSSACSPTLCPAKWEFLPAVKKDNGWYVYGVGTSAADIIAYLPGISPELCNWMQQTRPNIKTLSPPRQIGGGFDSAKSGTFSVGGGATTIKTEGNALDGRPDGCFNNSVGDGPNNFVYYFVLFAQ